MNNETREQLQENMTASDKNLTTDIALPSGQKAKEEADSLRTELRSYSFASMIGMILLLVLYTTQMLLGQGGNFGMCAVIFGLFAVQKTTLYIKLKRKKDRNFAVFYSITFIMTLVFYIITLCGKV